MNFMKMFKNKIGIVFFVISFLSCVGNSQGIGVLDLPNELGAIFCKGPGGSSGGTDLTDGNSAKALNLIIEISKSSRNPELAGTLMGIQSQLQTLKSECSKKETQNADMLLSVLDNQNMGVDLREQGSIADWIIFLLSEFKNLNVIDQQTEAELLQSFYYFNRSFSL